MNFNVEVQKFEQKFNEELNDLNVFTDGEKVTVYVPEDDSTFECELAENEFKGKVTRNDEYFKGDIELTGTLIADNIVCGTISGHHKDLPDVELTGSFSLHR